MFIEIAIFGAITLGMILGMLLGIDSLTWMKSRGFHPRKT